MSAPTLPDIEAAVIAYLLTDFDLDVLVSNRIYAELPKDVVYPCVTARRISGRAGVPRWIDGATIEVAGWGHRNVPNGRREARDACEAACRALNDLANTTSLDAILCGPLATNGPRSIPDQIATGVTNPRFIAEVSLTYHPAFAGS